MHHCIPNELVTQARYFAGRSGPGISESEEGRLGRVGAQGGKRIKDGDENKRGIVFCIQYS